MNRLMYLDPFSGIAGDMFLGLLLDLGVDEKELKKEFDKLDVPYYLDVDKVKKGGITATDVNVVVPEDVEERNKSMNLQDIVNILGRLDDPVRTSAIEMFEQLAEAEGKVHGMSKEEIHFHEVGAIDAIIEIVGALVGTNLLRIKGVYCGPLNIGTGFVETDHGTLPVPAPATAELLKNVPIDIKKSLETDTELVTPTGALILNKLVTGFKDLKYFTIQRVGYGAGDKELGLPNVLRGYIGSRSSTDSSKNVLVETNIDDMKPEICGYLMEELFESGALDVYYTPIYMKKNRPAFKLSVLCDSDKKDEMIDLIMEESTTIGVRVFNPDKIEAEREIKKVDTEYGEAKVKIARSRSNIINIAPEYESCSRLAKETGRPLKSIYNTVYQAALDDMDEEV